MTTLEIILTTLASILGSANVWQWFTLRSLRRTKEAEADQAQIKTISQIVNIATEQVVGMYRTELDSLQTRYDKLQENYDKLSEAYFELRNEFLELKRNQAAQ